ncbi:hypothetical protein TRFO_30958 [Tritrichomonas foetus]|uniref:Serine/threonine-protein phosphatase 4 regulatory subunit 3-like central domain-containing protein n=1 Tax=Tritrichomonas foetus TaxID=1144522 RepID=A0A1J4JTH1_9EUKA|nr:hypothetical protein TRFO_30958 [Tritrichomonas foetus]|eukprot:OHT02042.1 hypothetical protein TRFO_30958 [Tritrichomonas foetus]
MYLLSNEPINNSITRLFQSEPHPPIEKVIRDVDLVSSIRAEISVLIDYLVLDDVLPTLMQWALTTKGPDCEDSDRLVRSSVVILSIVSKNFQEKLQDNKIFIESLQKCLDDDISSNLQLCGHFQRIMESMIRYSNGGFLENFEDLCPYIIKNIHVLALKDLLQKLLTDFSDAFDEESYQAIVSDLAVATQNDNGYFAIVLMRDIVKEKKALLPFFQQQNVLRNLLKAATGTHKSTFHSLFEAQIFKFIEKIAQDFPSATAIIAEYSKKYKFDSKNITCGTVAALRVFKEGIYDLMPRFFIEPYITMLNDIILERIQQIPDKQVSGIVDKFKLAENIMRTFDTHMVNGHITDLALFLNKHPYLSKSLQTEEWKTFATQKLLQKDKLRSVTIEEEEEEEEKPVQYLSTNSRKPTLAPFNSFSGGGGISAMVQFAQAQVNKNMSFKKAANSHMNDDGGAHKGFTLAALMEDDSEEKPKKKKEKPKVEVIETKLNPSGLSFSIPTVYQAEDNLAPMVC